MTDLRVDVVAYAQRDPSQPLTDGEHHLIDWQYKRAEGSFFTRLMLAISCSDLSNRSRLMASFPSEVLAFHRFQNVPGYWDAVRERARIEGMML